MDVVFQALFMNFAGLRGHRDWRLLGRRKAFSQVPAPKGISLCCNSMKRPGLTLQLGSQVQSLASLPNLGLRSHPPRTLRHQPGMQHCMGFAAFPRNTPCTEGRALCEAEPEDMAGGHQGLVLASSCMSLQSITWRR